MAADPMPRRSPLKHRLKPGREAAAARRPDISRWLRHPALPCLVVLAALGLAVACSSPSPRQPEQKPQVILNTPEQDRQVGEESARQVDASIAMKDNPALSRYVDSIGQRLIRNAPRMGFDYEFKIVNQDAPNAFALPGGFVYVSRGLMALANNVDELAGVIGHEIVHVVRRHAAGRQSMQRAIPPIFRFQGMKQAAAYGRDQERESDRLGQSLAALSGYDPQGLANFLNQLEYTERLSLGFSRMPNFMDTHPATRERVSAAEARARSIRWQRQPGVDPDPADYLRRIDGLRVGTGGAEGVFRGDRFLHPELGFSLRFPMNWQLLNTPEAVVGVSPQRDAQIAFEFQGQGDDPQKAAEEFLAETEGRGGVRAERIAPIVIGEYPAFRVEGRAVGSPVPLAVHLTFIAHGGFIYRITGLSMGVSNAKAGIFNSVARSFRPITPRERASIRETRIRIVPAQGGESVQQLSQRVRNAWNIQELAVYNGVFADHRFEQGQLVKVALSQPYKGAGGR
jgi:predicted Zn-dependent protease